MSQQHSRRESLLRSTPAVGSATITVFAFPTSWIESDALAQCHQVAALDGMIHVAAMPDLRPGKGAPIGAAMASTVLYPFLVGSDIGCGIAVFPIKLKRAVPESRGRRQISAELGRVRRRFDSVAAKRADRVAPPGRPGEWEAPATLAARCDGRDPAGSQAHRIQYGLSFAIG